MLNLIKLEMKKFKLQGYVKGALITHLVLIALLLGLDIILKIENEPISDVLEASTMLVDSMGRITFVVFAGVMLAKIVIGEYSSKTINLMFMYPVSRKKIFISKLIIISVFTFINIVISNILLTTVLVMENLMFDFLPLILTSDSVINGITMMLLNSLLASVTALIPLYFGMKKKSAVTTIVSSLLVVTLMYSGNGVITVATILPIAIIAAIIGLLVGIGTLSKLDTEDVI